MSGTQGLFGGGAAGDEEKAKAQDFINRYQTGNPSEGYSEQEAIQQLQAVSKVATPEQMQQAFQQSVAKLPDDQRAQFNQMLQDRKAGQGMVDIDRSGDRKETTSRDSSGGGDAPGACPGHPACKHGKRPLGQQVLRQHRQAIRHRALSKGNAKILAATQYQPWQPPCLKRST